MDDMDQFDQDEDVYKVQQTSSPLVGTINKATMAEVLMSELNIDRNTAKMLVDRFFDLLSSHLEEGHTVKLPGLGNFSVRDKMARPGRNLRTGQDVTIKERRVVTFHPSGTLNTYATDALILGADVEARLRERREKRFRAHQAEIERARNLIF